MLSLRMIIVAGLAGIALWGLFNLLDNLREPGLLRTQQGVAVKGCDRLDEHPEAPRLCPQFVCQKALIDRKLVDLRAKFNVTVESGGSDERIIAGELTGTDRFFACTLKAMKVIDASLATREQLDEIASGISP